jgi:hypothetical protein
LLALLAFLTLRLATLRPLLLGLLPLRVPLGVTLRFPLTLGRLPRVAFLFTLGLARVLTCRFLRTTLFTRLRLALPFRLRCFTLLFRCGFARLRLALPLGLRHFALLLCGDLKCFTRLRLAPLLGLSYLALLLCCGFECFTRLCVSLPLSLCHFALLFRGGFKCFARLRAALPLGQRRVTLQFRRGFASLRLHFSLRAPLRFRQWRCGDEVPITRTPRSVR